MTLLELLASVDSFKDIKKEVVIDCDKWGCSQEIKEVVVDETADCIRIIID